MSDLSFTMSPAEQFLCVAIRNTNRIDGAALSRRYHALGDTTAFAAAQKNGVVPIVAHSLQTCCAETVDLPEHWLQEFQKTDARISSYMAELDRVAARLAEQNIPLIALKNSGITRGIYPHPGASPMGDIDVLISPSDFYTAHAVMEELGYTFKFRNIYENEDLDEAFAGGGTEYSYKLPDGEHLWFELQWRPIAGRWIQPEQEPKADDLLARAKPAEKSDVMLLSPEDNLLQVCLHTAKHSYVRAPGFRLHTDVERIVTCEAINWDYFIAEVKELRVCTACYFSLAMANSLLGTPVPNYVLASLSPSPLKRRRINRALDKVGVFNPNERKWSNMNYILFVASLYDGRLDLWRAVFPPLATMRGRYEGVSRLTLPWFHLRRLSSMLLRRTGI